jgi:hypothetical protein
MKLQKKSTILFRPQSVSFFVSGQDYANQQHFSRQTPLVSTAMKVESKSTNHTNKGHGGSCYTGCHTPQCSQKCARTLFSFSQRLATTFLSR